MAKSSKFGGKSGGGGSTKVDTKQGKENISKSMAKSGMSLAKGGTRNQKKGTKI